MTIGELKCLIKKYNIPDETVMWSDSGWECSETEMDGVYYNAERKQIVFTQDCSKYEKWDIRSQRESERYGSKPQEKHKGFIAIGKEME